MPAPALPNPQTLVLALIAYTDHREHAVCFVFSAPTDLEVRTAEMDALRRIPEVAPDPDGWMSYDHRPFQGTRAELDAVADRLAAATPGGVAGRWFPAARPTEILSVAEALARVPDESPAHTIREFMASLCNTQGYNDPWAAAIRAAAPTFDPTCQVLFDRFSA